MKGEGLRLPCLLISFCRFDHFCQFTDQPVGQKNHLMFLLALSFVCIHFNLFAYISFRRTLLVVGNMVAHI